MSKLSEIHRKNSFEYISFLIDNLLNKIREVENEWKTDTYATITKSIK